MTPEEKAAMQRRANGGGIIYWGSDVVGFGVDAWNSMNTLQKASMFLAPIASDIAGVLGDIQMYREQPDTRGMLNYGMTPNNSKEEVVDLNITGFESTVK